MLVRSVNDSDVFVDFWMFVREQPEPSTCPEVWAVISISTFLWVPSRHFHSTVRAAHWNGSEMSRWKWTWFVILYNHFVLYMYWLFGLWVATESPVSRHFGDSGRLLIASLSHCWVQWRIEFNCSKMRSVIKVKIVMWSSSTEQGWCEKRGPTYCVLCIFNKNMCA